MTSVNADIVEEMVNAIVREVHPEQVYVFGSAVCETSLNR
jgi:hypothetical protein